MNNQTIHFKSQHKHGISLCVDYPHVKTVQLVKTRCQEGEDLVGKGGIIYGKQVMKTMKVIILHKHTIMGNSIVLPWHQKNYCYGLCPNKVTTCNYIGIKL